MHALVVPLAVICSLGLAGVVLSFVAILQSKSLARVLEQRAQARQASLEGALGTTKETVESLAAGFRDIQQPPVPAPPASGFNLSKRSQALRMHRRGDSPKQIATALHVPLQEIDLLLKVHRIVLRNLVVTTKSDVRFGQGGLQPDMESQSRGQ